MVNISLHKEQRNGTYTTQKHLCVVHVPFLYPRLFVCCAGHETDLNGSFWRPPLTFQSEMRKSVRVVFGLAVLHIDILCNITAYRLVDNKTEKRQNRSGHFGNRVIGSLPCHTAANAPWALACTLLNAACTNITFVLPRDLLQPLCWSTNLTASAVALMKSLFYRSIFNDNHTARKQWHLGDGWFGSLYILIGSKKFKTWLSAFKL